MTVQPIKQILNSSTLQNIDTASRLNTNPPNTDQVPNTSSMEAINNKIIPANTIKEQTNNTEDIETEEKIPHLRPKLVKLCEELIKGTPRIEAHKIAKFKAKTDEARSQAVSDYLKKPEIAKYISIRENQERIKLEIQTNVTKLWVLEQLKYGVEYSRDNNKVRDLVAATAEINRMQGYNAPVKVDNTISAANSSMDISLLTPEEKLALSNMLKKIYAKPAGSLPAKVIGKIEAAK
jgi:hypothetical protein